MEELINPPEFPPFPSSIPSSTLSVPMVDRNDQTLLLTGFGLWDSETRNSSWEAIRDLDLDLPVNWSVRRQKLPVDWELGPPTLRSLIDDTIVTAVCFGMCGGSEIRPERLAANLNDRNRRDAREALSRSDHVVEEGPPAYWTALDYESLVGELRSAGLPTVESRDAGGFLCNAIFYTLMHERKQRRASFPAGFIHLPHIEPDEGLSLAILKRAVGICIDHAIGLVKQTESRHIASPTLGGTDL
jgi:pyroglutamyl-peptidase